MNKTFKIKGMHCNSCAKLIEDGLRDKVDKISVSYTKESATIEFNKSKITEKEIEQTIIKLGYAVDADPKPDVKHKVWAILSTIGLLFLVIVVLYSLLKGFDFGMSWIRIPQAGESISLLILFAAGLLTGFHCISMCGGFIVSYTTKNALNGHKSFSQHLVYGIAKTFSYALIGGLFGLVGGFIAFNTQLRGWVAIFAGIFMVFYSLSMFGIKFFRKFQVNPKFLSKVAAKSPKGSYLGPLFTGLLTGLFVACGPLQAMYLYAIGSGSFRVGAISLSVFGLGTLPVLIGFGSLVTMISHKTTAKILKVSAALVLLLGLIMINNGLALTGSSYDFSSLKNRLIGTTVNSSNQTIIVDGVQEIKMTIDNTNWSPEVFVLKRGMPARWIIDAKKLPCATEIYVHEYGLDIKLNIGINTVEFTPNRSGTVKWTCWMGMVSGNFIVTDDGQAGQDQINSAAPSCTGHCQMMKGNN